MSNYTRYLNQVCEFDGDTIKITARRLTRVEFLSLQPLFEVGKGEDGQVTITLPKRNESAYFELSEEILFNAVQAVSGLFIEGEQLCFKVGDPKPDLFKEILGATYFLPLWQTVVGHITEQSSIKKEDAAQLKKSAETHNES